MHSERCAITVGGVWGRRGCGVMPRAQSSNWEKLGLGAQLPTSKISFSEANYFKQTREGLYPPPS